MLSNYELNMDYLSQLDTSGHYPLSNIRWWCKVSMQLRLVTRLGASKLLLEVQEKNQAEFVVQKSNRQTQHMRQVCWANYVQRVENKKAQISLTNPRDAKACQNYSNSTCLQRCRWQYWPIFIRLAAVASEICEIPRNSLKIQTYGAQDHPRSSILVSIESPCTTSY